MKLNRRQIEILELLQEKSPQPASEIEEFFEVSRSTLNRDLDLLLNEGKIRREGQGRGTVYLISKEFTYTKSYPDSYFEQGPAQREAKTSYSTDITDDFRSIEIFDTEEKEELRALTEQYRENRSKLGQSITRKELERIIIELSWMSSKIEGNTYSLIETEVLLKKNKEAEARTKAETQMILNHKEAFNYLLVHQEDFRELSVEKIIKVHSLLIKDLEVSGLRNVPVGITGTLYRPLPRKEDIRGELKRVVNLINQRSSSFDKVLIANLFLAYLQPFKDGNKRTSRLIGNALLLAYDSCPLSLLTLDEAEYRKALILFYEQNNISLFKDILMEQYRFSVKNYFVS